jgi:hypothetical protein
MPVWVWLLLGLTALGLLIRVLEGATGTDLTERHGKALTILFILALIGGLVLGFMNMDWE